MRHLMLPVVGLVLAATTGLAVDITTCGVQLRQNKEVGELRNDLVCPEASVSLVAKGTTLNLNGYSITATGAYAAVGVYNSGTIRGPGTIAAATSAVYAGGRRLRISDVEIRDSATAIVADVYAEPPRGKVQASNLMIHDIAYGAIHAFRTVAGENISIVRTGTAAGQPSLDYALGRAGIRASKVKVNGLVASDNAGFAVVAKSANIRNGVLGSNDLHGAGYDMLTFRRPRLRDTTCSRSGRLDRDPLPAGGTTIVILEPWFVCADD
jgi:hypothetical protein